jgi:hypothetical protein
MQPVGAILCDRYDDVGIPQKSKSVEIDFQRNDRDKFESPDYFIMRAGKLPQKLMLRVGDGFVLA